MFESPLNKQVVYSAAEMELAKLKFVLDCYDDHMYTILHDSEQTAGEILQTVVDFQNDVDLTDTTSIDKFADKHCWQSFVRSLSEMHFGDCTGHPCSCERCRIEGFLDSTVTWTKSQGRAMVAEYDFKEFVYNQVQLQKST